MRSSPFLSKGAKPLLTKNGFGLCVVAKPLPMHIKVEIEAATAEINVQ